MTPFHTGTPAPSANEIREAFQQVSASGLQMRPGPRRYLEQIAPFPQQMARNKETDRIPSPDQTDAINEYLKNNPTGQTYIIHEDLSFSKKEKSQCDLQYICGKTVVVDDQGYVLHKSHCCHCHGGLHPPCTCCNCAECAMVR
ncbi:hypothetical protein PCASD_24460 [Puccinia coronata f. sp. avenae]|uniref:Uncharacterized protein n=1 Tax=Puccinia coronata f. sp. avenae TaxID=200324 RepID=A0A2N5TJ87_9BASI|nr:hypothetical protein PCASD_24460 [Puccinia coronata f. sp. avenae]